MTAAVRVSERRSRLLGLDEPVVTKTELTGSLGVYAERLAAERAILETLDVTQLEELAVASQALVDRALTMARANGLKAIPATTPLTPAEDAESGGPGPNSTDVEDA